MSKRSVICLVSIFMLIGLTFAYAQANSGAPSTKASFYLKCEQLKKDYDDLGRRLNKLLGVKQAEKLPEPPPPKKIPEDFVNPYMGHENDFKGCNTDDCRKVIVNNEGISYARQGYFGLAEKKFDDALRLDPNFEAAQLNLEVLRSKQAGQKK